MRLLGCLSVFLCILMLGVSHKLKLDIRSRQWREMQILLRLCIEELQISQRDSEKILQSIWDRGFHSDFLDRALCVEGTIQQRLEHASQILIDSNLAEIAQNFAHRFGMSSLDLQMESLQSLLRVCAEGYEESRRIAAQNGKLALNIGIFGGAAVVIILL